VSDKFTKRELFRASAAGLMVAATLPRKASAQAIGAGDQDAHLYSAPGLPGGGQLEVRLTANYWDVPDPDAVDLAQRLRPYDPESWHVENRRLAERNEERARQRLAEGLKVTAAEFYLRSVGFWRNAVLYLPEEDSRMLPTYAELQRTFDAAWSLVPRPFERIEIPFEGKMLKGHFFAARAPAGAKLPVVFNYGGADGILLTASPDGNSGPFRARGISYLDLDAPGMGTALRMEKIYAPHDAERVGKAVVDYLTSRPDVDARRIGLQGSSMGGYYAPRCATADHRIAAVAVWSGAYALQQDIFDYYPPIQHRLRWLIGARNLPDARRMMGDFTLAGQASKIECPLLVGYSVGDRVMDPHGAFSLYEAATKSADRSIIEGTGHGGRRFETKTALPDWFAKQFAKA
jgi:dienelactone hydrolase